MTAIKTVPLRVILMVSTCIFVTGLYLWAFPLTCSVIAAQYEVHVQRFSAVGFIIPIIMVAITEDASVWDSCDVTLLSLEKWYALQISGDTNIDAHFVFYILKQRVLIKAIFLGAFAKLRKATVSFFMFVSPHETTRLPLDGFWWNLTFELFRKSVEKIQVSLTSDMINGYFTWRRSYIFDDISLNSS